MAIRLDHTIVPAKSKIASAGLFAEIFGLTVTPEHFAQVQVNEHLTLDFADEPEEWGAGRPGAGVNGSPGWRASAEHGAARHADDHQRAARALEPTTESSSMHQNPLRNPARCRGFPRAFSGGPVCYMGSRLLRPHRACSVRGIARRARHQAG